MEVTTSLKTEPTDCVVCGLNAGHIVARGRDYLHATTDQQYQFFECSGCGHLYLNPRPSIDEIARLYPTDYVTFSGSFAGDNSSLANIKDAVLARRFRGLRSMLPADAAILDIGCGDAQFLMALRRMVPGARLDGLDWYFSPPTLERMRGSHIGAITGTIETADIPENSYDAINMNQLIEHVWDVRRVLKRCFTALKPGGILAIETPNRSGWDRRFFKDGAWGGYYWPRHLNLFSKEGLRTVAEQCDFQIVDQTDLLAPPCWITSARVSLQRSGFDRLSGFVSDTNFALLGSFAAIDRIALTLGAQTSNQKLIARKL